MSDINCVSSLCLHSGSLNAAVTVNTLADAAGQEALQITVRSSVSSSEYLTHLELLLLTMLSSPDQEERTEVVEIICIRKGARISTYLPRKFQVPSLNFETDQLS